MQLIRGLVHRADRQPLALTIGNFDGVHRGHQSLLSQLVAAARARRLSAAVMTFEPHPREFFAPDQAPPRIANLRDKVAALAASGVDQVFIQHFNRRFAQRTAESFIDEILVGALSAQYLLVGDDFRFGAKRRGDVTMLRERAAAEGFDVAQVQTFEDEGLRVSSSAVRAALSAGDLLRAERLLGRPYAISGRVLHGRKLGRTLGFPTLNLRLNGRRPAVQGIFAVLVHGLAVTALPGVASVGLRPTVESEGRWLLEVNVFDFSSTVYGRLVRVQFIRKLRDEFKYSDLDALRQAIADDAVNARQALREVRSSL